MRNDVTNWRAPSFRGKRMPLIGSCMRATVYLWLENVEFCVLFCDAIPGKSFTGIYINIHWKRYDRLNLTWGRSELTDRNVELYPQLFLELITTQLRFYMVSPQFSLLIILTMQSYKLNLTYYGIWGSLLLRGTVQRWYFDFFHYLFSCRKMPPTQKMSRSWLTDSRMRLIPLTWMCSYLICSLTSAGIRSDARYDLWTLNSSLPMPGYVEYTTALFIYFLLIHYTLWVKCL